MKFDDILLELFERGDESLDPFALRLVAACGKRQSAISSDSAPRDAAPVFELLDDTVAVKGSRILHLGHMRRRLGLL